MSEPKKHHYVPQWILRNFSFDKEKKKICVVDKIEGQTRSGAILKLGMQNNFYKYKESGKNLEIDFVRDIDTAGSVAFSKAKEISVANLKDDDKQHLRRFFAAQILRTPTIFSSLQRFDEDLRSELGEEFTIIKKSAHSDFLDSLVKNIDLLEKSLQSRTMRILESEPNKHRFVIGDSPVYHFNYGEKTRILHGHGLPIIDSDFMAMPLTPFAILVFYKEKPELDLKELINQNNEWQFINSDRFVFSNTEEHLKQGLKTYYKISYNYINSLDSSMPGKQGIQYGDRVDVRPMRIAFSDELKKELIKKFGDNTKSS